METVRNDFAPKGVKFYYIYKSLAHPGIRGYVSPLTIQERLMHVHEAKRLLGSKIPWLCDTMDNDFKHALGNAQNSEFLIDPEGKVITRQPWSHPENLRKVLETIIGPVDQPTTLSDLGTEFIVKWPSSKIPSGLIPKLQLPNRMVPLTILPLKQERSLPFYVKLHAQADHSFLDHGKGTLYLGFFLDPIYKVHWNNLTKPLEFSIKIPTGVNISPTKGFAAKVKETSDKDPREFILAIDSSNYEQPLVLKTRYFACDDADTFCVPVTQQYSIYLKPDLDGGSMQR